MKKFLALFSARNKEYWRDTSALVWHIAFPVLVIFGFAFSFSDSSQSIFKAAVYRAQGDSALQGGAGPVRNEGRGATPAPTSLHPGFQAGVDAKGNSERDFFSLKYIQFVEVSDLQEALAKLKRHQYDVVLSEEEAGKGKYWINSTSPKGYLLERIIWSSVSNGFQFIKQTVEGKEIRYVDWLISGLLGMNMMFSALFGVGYTIVRYRKNGVLRRLKATPISSFEFLMAQVVSRLFLIIVMTTVIYFGSHFFIHFQMLGSYIDLFIILTLGAMSLISLSLMVASQTASEEFAGGLLNLISWPMMFLSGVWFSLEGAAPWVRKIAQVFPLTHVIDASRAIMTEGATLNSLWYNVITLILMTVVFLGVGSFTFKWK